MSLYESPTVPVCPVDQFRMIATAVGWRCPICGLARLPLPAPGDGPGSATHPSLAGHRVR